jgi:hypothetical protein
MKDVKICINTLAGNTKYVLILKTIIEDIKYELVVYDEKYEELKKFFIFNKQEKQYKLIIESHRLENIFNKEECYSILDPNDCIYSSLDNRNFEDFKNLVYIKSDILTLVTSQSINIKDIQKLRENTPLNDESLIKYRDNYIFVRYAVRCCPFNLQYASEKLKDNLDIVKIAVSKNGITLQYASTDLKNNPNIVEIAVLNNPEALEFASDELKEDDAIVIPALNRNGKVIRFSFFQNYPFIAQIAICNNGGALEHVSDNLKNNKHIVILACEKSIKNLQFASIKLQNDYNIIEKIIEKSDNYISLYSFLEDIYQINMSLYEKLCNDKKIIKKIVYFNIKYLITSTNMEILYEELTLLKNINESVYTEIINEYNTIKESILISKYYTCLENMLNIIKKLSLSLHEKIINDVDIAMYMIRNKIHTMLYFSKNIKDNKEVVSMAVNIKGFLLKHASSRLCDDDDIVKIAINNDNTSIKHASLRLRKMLKK